MKKWIICLLIGSGALSAFCEEVPKENASATTIWDQERPREFKKFRKQVNKKMERRHKDGMEKARHAQRELEKLARDAREESDPAKKEALVSELRVKVTEQVNHMQEDFEKNLARAEEQIEKMKKHLAESLENKDEWIEQCVQDLLDGNKPPKGGRGPKGGHGPNGKHEHGGRHGEVPPPPPPQGEGFGEEPPPPAPAE